MVKYNNIISKFSKKRILVVGDLILDQYVQGSVSRISPEAPVPIILQDKSYYSSGGAANVASNLVALSAGASLVGRVGDDIEAEILKKDLKKQGVEVKGIFTDKKLPTVLKTRVIASNQQVARIDREASGVSGEKKTAESIVAFLEKNISKFDAVIISDYGKGLVTPELIELVSRLCSENQKAVVVDPKVENFGHYQGVTCITPNLMEAENAIRNIKITSKSRKKLGVHIDKLRDDQNVDLAGKELLKYLGLESLLITLGEQGMRLFEKGKKPFSIKTKAQEVYDVTGAGDSVISTFTLALTAGATKKEAADMANSAAGVVVGKKGCVPISKKELLAAIKG